MKINQITLTDLRRMNGKEGLILQGCGGETREWVDGINKMLTDKGILLDDTKFENVSVFKSDGVTCILYPFEDVHLDIGKQDLPVKLNNGSELTAMVYIMNLKQNFGLPSASYYDTVSQGYKDCGFDLKVLNEAVTNSAEKFYENLEQNNLFDSPDEDMGMGGMSL